MTESEVEMMKMAAKAAGARLTDYSDGVADHWELRRSDGVWRPWNPLEDDGDAFRLSVNLRMNVDVIDNAADETSVWVRAQNYPKASAFGGREGDDYAATRRAIVQVAAEIGRANSA